MDENKASVGRRRRSQAAEVWKRMRRNRLAMVGWFIVVCLILMAVFADQIADYDTLVIKQNIPDRLLGPSPEHWFGTDEFGRDIFARLVHGSRISLLVGTVAVCIALVTGGTLGAVAGYFGGKVDNIIMRVMDIFLSIPILLMAIMIVAALGTSMVNLMIAIGVSSMPTFARVTRAAVLSVKVRNTSRRPGPSEGRPDTLFCAIFCPTACPPLLCRPPCVWRRRSCRYPA